MKSNHDLVDQAMNLLRSGGDAAGPTLNPELENKLMQKFDAHTTSARPMRAKTLVIALALVAVSGVTFAATGGIERIKSWLFTVEVGGQQVQLIVGDNQEGTIVSENEDGTKTEVTVNKGTTKSGNDRTKVRVVQEGPNEKRISESVMVRGHGPEEPEQQYTFEDIGKVEPTKTWTDKEGRLNEVYMVPTADGEGAQVFYVKAVDTEEMRIHKIAQPPGQWFGEGITRDVEVDDNGMFTISASFPDGGRKVIKIGFRDERRSGGEAEADERDIRINSPDGDVKIKVEERTEPENP